MSNLCLLHLLLFLLLLLMLLLQSAKADNGLGGEVYVNKYDAHIVEKEEDSGYISKMFEPRMPVVINEHARNKWGTPRGYKVCRPCHPGVIHSQGGVSFQQWPVTVCLDACFLVL